MGSFTQSLLNISLSWLRSVVESLWAIVNSDTTKSSLEWMGKHWIVPVAVIILVGIGMDYLIWLIRWRPFYVWRSSFARLKRRLSGQKEETEEQRSHTKRERPSVKVPRTYATPAYDEEEMEQTQSYTSLGPGYDEAIDATRKVPAAQTRQAYDEAATAVLYHNENMYTAPFSEKEIPAAAPVVGTVYRQSAYHNAAYMPPKTTEMSYDEAFYDEMNDGEGLGAEASYGEALYEDASYVQGEYEDTPYSMPSPMPRQPRRQNKRPRKSMLKGIGSAAGRFLASDDSDDEIVSYHKPKPRVSEAEAFHAPAYPPNWQQENNPDFMEDEPY